MAKSKRQGPADEFAIRRVRPPTSQVHMAYDNPEDVSLAKNLRPHIKDRMFRPRRRTRVR